MMQDNDEDRIDEKKNHPLIDRQFKSVGNYDSEKSFRVLQYNILADALSFSTPTENFCKVPSDCLQWSFRKGQLLKQILALEADIICLEEVDHFHDCFLPKLSCSGYDGFFFAKKNSPCLRYAENNGADGVAIFYRQNIFELKETSGSYLMGEDGKEGNNGILVAVFEHIVSKAIMIVGVTHLKAKKGFEACRKIQSASAVDILKIVKSSYDPASVILCGDFNGEPNEPFYDAILNSDLKLKSAYEDAMKSEPDFTTWKIRPASEVKHTIDYIWYSADLLSVAGVLCLMSDDDVPAERFPSFGQPSDHIPLCCDFVLN